MASGICIHPLSITVTKHHLWREEVPWAHGYRVQNAPTDPLQGHVPWACVFHGCFQRLAFGFME